MSAAKEAQQRAADGFVRVDMELQALRAALAASQRTLLAADEGIRDLLRRMTLDPDRGGIDPTTLLQDYHELAMKGDEASERIAKSRKAISEIRGERERAMGRVRTLGFAADLEETKP